MKKLLATLMVFGFIGAMSVPAMAAEDNFYMSGFGGVAWSDGTSQSGDYVDEEGWNIGLAVGNRIQEHVRLEAEYMYLDTTSDNDMTVNSLMGNIYYDFGTWGGFTPYVTTGIGLGWFDADNADSDEAVVWKGGFGADYAVNDKWSVGMRYTYMESVDSVDFDADVVNAVVTMHF